jgi:cyclophilin family peptidyl-prolyl cis-trans isomerase
MSICTNNTGDFKETIMNCTKALYLDEKAVKALYLRSVAFTKTAQLDEAMDDIKNAIKLAPTDKSLRTHFELVKKEKAEKSKTQKAAIKKFFEEGVYNDKKAPLPNFTALPDFKESNVQVYFDMEIGKEGEEGHEKGRVVMELFDKTVPKTAENFRALCTGEKGSDLHYKGNKFHRIIKGFMMQGGDTTMGNGTGGKSIYGHKFDDEGVWYPHTHAGVLSMANSGPNTNGSQFFICYGATPHLNGKHTIYGRIISGMLICNLAAEVKTGASDKPLLDVAIADCGELTGDQKLKASDANFLATYKMAQTQIAGNLD